MRAAGFHVGAVRFRVRRERMPPCRVAGSSESREFVDMFSRRSVLAVTLAAVAPAPAIAAYGNASAGDEEERREDKVRVAL